MNLEYYQDYFCFKLSQNNTVSDINYLLLVTLGFDGGFVFVFGHGLFGRKLKARVDRQHLGKRRVVRPLGALLRSRRH